MSLVADVEELALKLSDSERGSLANKLIASLPTPYVDDDDDWAAEAIRRDREMDENPDCVLTHEEFMAGLEEFRR